MTGPESRPIPEAFERRKRKILAELSIPDAEYTDLSPKGSVDEGIRELIDDINTLPGLVTTSSCAGRFSVFLEGRKKQHQQQSSEVQQRQFVPSGGKGAGKWLYVSHDALKEYGEKQGEEEDEEEENNKRPLHRLFGMIPGDGKPPKLDGSGQAPRLVRFSYEPMVNALQCYFVPSFSLLSTYPPLATLYTSFIRITFLLNHLQHAVNDHSQGL